MKFLKERVFLAVFSRTLLDLGLWVGEKRGESLVVLRSAVACSEGTERDRVFFGGRVLATDSSDRRGVGCLTI